MNEITFEKAKKIAEESAKEYDKIIVSIYENDEYWLFCAGPEDNSLVCDNGAGSIYVSKKDGSTKIDNYYLSEFNQNFFENACEIYNIFGEN